MRMVVTTRIRGMQARVMYKIKNSKSFGNRYDVVRERFLVQAKEDSDVSML